MAENNARKIPLLLPFSAFFIWGCILTAAFLHSGFNWPDNLLSDLGVSDVSYIFSTGLVGGGLLGLLFTVFFIKYYRSDLLNLVNGILLLATNISYILAGLIPISAGFLHYFFAFLAFALSIFICGLSSIIFVMWRKKYFKLGLYGLTVLLISFLIWIFIRLPGIAVTETAVGLLISSWFSILGVTLYRSWR
ncbi:MAG: DUF998 domain-containing protein [Candidatus Odinarchaeum yellowstonii]|uniref:DUF998 domain-containing protein n=1 Tax=Odinarchaeota yellowstonii (strain LCB_4) TaxID=1841599 RepID=A0AAF0D3D4_ODILC|nr:MAG: DUF998 domain-containing protein [Candidatus Odinarchaeum yellowstonii]